MVMTEVANVAGARPSAIPESQAEEAAFHS